VYVFIVFTGAVASIVLVARGLRAGIVLFRGLPLGGRLEVADNGVIDICKSDSRPRIPGHSA
jgi:hypothetical protein